jgi:hypothetical protein
MDDASEAGVVVVPVNAGLMTTDRPVETMMIGVATMQAVMVVE